MDNHDQKNIPILPNWIYSLEVLRAAIKQYRWDRGLSGLSPNFIITGDDDKVVYQIEDVSE